jgi:tetratricopeptide (TPR) repeat protein
MATLPLCISCKHFPGAPGETIETLPTTCAAFPGGIPRAILEGDTRHLEPYPGDGGIRFEPYVGLPRAYRAGGFLEIGEIGEIGFAEIATVYQETSIPLYREWLRKEPDNEAVLVELIAHLTRFGGHEEAIRHLEVAIGRNPEDGAAHLLLGGCFCELERWDEAVVELREAIRLGRGGSVTHLGLGDALQRTHRLEEARVEWEKALDPVSEWIAGRARKRLEDHKL